MAEADGLQTLASLEYGWVGAEIKGAEMRRVKNIKFAECNLQF